MIELSERLVDITPPNLDKCFYADNGSSAIEVALKMSYHYWRNSGQPRKKNFVNLSNSYHGETLGALALGDVGLYKDTYEPLLMEVLTAPSPDAYHREPGESWEDVALRQFEQMEALLARHHEEVCAVIVEPLVQCAGNMRMYHPVYLSKLREACDRYNVHLIADEIAVGFGRTGTLFACEQADISPDFMCLSKGLTAGYLPLSVVLTSNQVYNAFYDDYETLRAFLHSHSYTGNPIGCAVALETLNIFRDDNVVGQQPQTGPATGRCHSPSGRPPPCGGCAPARHDCRRGNGQGQGQPDAISLAGTPGPQGFPARPYPAIPVAAPGQRGVLHAALCHHRGADRPSGPGGGRRYRQGCGRLRTLSRLCASPVSIPRRPWLSGQDSVLDDSAAHHVLKVLRMQAGQALVLFNGDGHDYAAVLTETGKKQAWCPH